MAGFDDLARKANDFVKSEKVQKAMKSKKAEGVSDKVLDGVAGFANKVTGGKHEDTIANAKKTADEKLGRGDGDPGPDGTDPGPDGELGPDGSPRPR